MDLVVHLRMLSWWEVNLCLSLESFAFPPEFVLYLVPSSQVWPAFPLPAIKKHPQCIMLLPPCFWFAWFALSCADLPQRRFLNVCPFPNTAFGKHNSSCSFLSTLALLLSFSINPRFLKCLSYLNCEFL